MRYDDIPRMTRPSNYQVHQPWRRLPDWVKRHQKDLGLEIDPDFQRAHVWDDEKRRRYVEFILREGQSSKDIYFNCAGWMGDWRGPFVLVDGKQRLDAVLKFLDNKLTVFDGHLFSDFEDRIMPLHACFVVHVNNLNSRAEVLQWYCDLNSGGVAHTDDEIRKVKDLLAIELKRK